MQKHEVYEKIVAAFEHDYGWLGRQFSEQFLLSCASWNIQQFSFPNFRIRRHLLLFWQAGYLKSTLLVKAYELLSPELCTIMTDVSLAALRGSVDFGRFVSPYTLKRPFSICTEFGQVVAGYESTEIIQKLLNVLEEGMVTVSLGKIGSLSALDREEISKEYGITFIDNNTFTYKTNWVLMAGTYNRKFLVDNAFESRFVLMIPEKELDNNLTKYINNTKPEGIDVALAAEFRRHVLDPVSIPLEVKLPDEIYAEESNLTLRQSSYLLSHILCKSWWGVKVDAQEIIDLAKTIKVHSDSVWRSADDKVFDAIDSASKTADEIKKETGLSKRQVYYSLRKIHASTVLEEGVRKWRIL